MKLRLRGNSLRLRLQRAEVALLAELGTVSETLRFAPDSALVYTVEASDEVERLAASFDASRITVRVPRAAALRWATSDEVSLFADEPLRILVEKDFACLKPRDAAAWEDESDAFPNPNPSCGGAP